MGFLSVGPQELVATINTAHLVNKRKSEKPDNLPALLPFSRICDLEHGLTSLVHQIQGVKCIEVDTPVAFFVLDCNKIVTKNHFRGRNAEPLGHFLDRLGFEYGQLLR